MYSRDVTREHRPRLAILGFSVLLLAALPAALMLVSSSSNDSENRDEGAAGTLSALVGGGSEQDFEPLSSPAALAADVTKSQRLETQAGAVVDGTIVGYEPGEVQDVGADYPEDPGDQPIIMNVNVDTVLAKKNGDPSETVAVQLPGTEPDQTADRLDALRKELPEGTEVILYLVKPESSDLYVVTPQGFLATVRGKKGVIEPRVGVQYPDASLKDFEPSRRSFPEKARSLETNSVSGPTQ